MTDGTNILDEPVKIDERSHYNIQKITNGQGDNYTGVTLLHDPYFEKQYKMATKHLSKQQQFDAEKKSNAAN